MGLGGEVSVGSMKLPKFIAIAGFGVYAGAMLQGWVERTAWYQQQAPTGLVRRFAPYVVVGAGVVIAFKLAHQLLGEGK